MHPTGRHCQKSGMLQWWNNKSEGKIDNNYWIRRLENSISPVYDCDDQKDNIIGRNILPQIGVKLIQEKEKQNVLSVREQEESDPKIKQWVKTNFQQLCVRIGKSKNHMMRTQFNRDFIPLKQKIRRIPVHLQERVEGELNKLMDQNHIIKIDKCSDRQFISPIVITVKKIKQSNSR